jgi:glycosyltransferase involved in cell wall biosynthesis
MKAPLVSVVIGSYNRRNCLCLCIEAVRTELRDVPSEIIVVDGGSTDGALEWLASQKDIVTIIQHNRGEWQGKPVERRPWSYFMNLGFRSASAEYICMLSDDSLIVPGAIVNGLELFQRCRAERKKVGALAFYFRDFPVRKRHSVAINLGSLYVNHGLFLREAMAEVGYCDEEYHFYFADTDLSLKIQHAGYEVLACERSFVEHYFDATPEIRAGNNDERKEQDRNRLIEKWKGIAYPAQHESRYRKHVGFWRAHPRGFEGPDQTIRCLVESCRPDMAGKPKISVVTVVLNDPEGLQRTIDSVRVQSYPLIDFVVIDGGSDKATQLVLERNIDSMDRMLSEPDGGIYDAMNKGLALSSGEFVVFMNAGDTFVDSGTVERVAEKLLDDIDVLYGHRQYRKPAGDLVLQEAPGISRIAEGMPFCHQSAFLRRQLLLENPFNTTYKFAGDYEQIVRLHKAGHRFQLLDMPICEYLGGGLSESGIRPYLECLKIQFDHFGDGANMKSSRYMRGFIDNLRKLTEKYQ